MFTAYLQLLTYCNRWTYLDRLSECMYTECLASIQSVCSSWLASCRHVPTYTAHVHHTSCIHVACRPQCHATSHSLVKCASCVLLQAEKKARQREKEKERKRTAAEKKAKAAEGARAVAEAEVATAAAEAAALASK